MGVRAKVAKTRGDLADRSLLRVPAAMNDHCLIIAAVTIAVGAVGCGSSSSSSSPQDAGGDGSTVTDDGGGTDAPTESASDAGGDAGPVSVSFAYAPQWDGVTKVEVVGGFGLTSDWSKTQSLLTLTKSGTTYSGTVALPPGTYLYVFRVTGDALAPVPATYERYAVDPLDTAFAACPMASPTYSKIDVNPCSQITVTSAGGPMPAAAVHVKGSVSLDGAAASGWMVWIEREEPKSHHYFANRVTTGTDGSFDVIGSAGSYRLQVQYPTLLAQTDLQRDPTSLQALRRAISAAFVLGASDLTVPTPDVGFHAYTQFAPTGDGGTLPTQFAFETAASARLDVYGGAGDGGVVNIGDPWYASAPTATGGATFDGGFNTKQAAQTSAVPGTRYMWGTEESFGADAGLAWTDQSMVFPIAWQ